MKKVMLLMLLLAGYIYASVGKVVALSGDAIITRDGKQVKATKASELEKSDVIKTDNNSKMQILFNDETIISVGKNSTLKISDYVFEKNNVKAEFTMGNGVFRTITGKIGKIAPDNFKLKTKSASIGIRGTQIVTEVDDKVEKIFCTEGKIEVSYSNPSIGTNVVVKGHFVTILDGNVSEKIEVQTIKKDDLKEINKDLIIVDNFATDDISMANNSSNVVDDVILADTGDKKDSNNAINNSNSNNLVATAKDISKLKNDSTSSAVDQGSSNNNSSNNSENNNSNNSDDNNNNTSDNGSTNNGGSNNGNTNNGGSNNESTDNGNTNNENTNNGGSNNESTDNGNTNNENNTDNLANLTPDTFFDNNTAKATYSGNFNSVAYNSQSQYFINTREQKVAIPSSTTIKMDVDFGATSNQITNGTININDEANEKITNLTFNGNINSSNSVTLAGTNFTSGSGTGNFFGNTAQSLKGDVNMKDVPSNVELRGAYTTTKE